MLSIVQLSRFFVYVVLFKRQLLYFIKSFCLCQELFYFSFTAESVWLLLTSSVFMLSHSNFSVNQFLSSLLINLFLELFLSQGLSASAPSSYSSVCSVVFSAVLSDECYLIIAISNCQCFLYISCNSEYSEKLASAFPDPNRFCKLACNKLVEVGNIGRMPLTDRTSVLSVVADA